MTESPAAVRHWRRCPSTSEVSSIVGAFVQRADARQGDAAVPHDGTRAGRRARGGRGEQQLVVVAAAERLE